MARLRLLTAGESHGPALVALLEGIPAGLSITKEVIDRDLARRQVGYGRGGRMKIEKDEVEILAGLRGGRTLGSPLALVVRNRDHASWRDVMDPFAPPVGERARALTRPRPGHADLAGALKLHVHDARDVLERASARSTAARVAAGAIARALLAVCGMRVVSHVVAIGEASAPRWDGREDLAALAARTEGSDVRAADEQAATAMRAAIDTARRAGDSLGGLIELIADGVPPGLGSYTEWDLRLDGRLGQALLSIQAIKAVEIGDGWSAAGLPGLAVHDAIFYENGRFVRPTNRAGGVEGGVTNGEPLVLRIAMKPIPTLARPLPSVDLATKEAFDAARERTDSVAVPAAGVVAEAALAFVLADALLDKTGGDTLDEVRDALAAHLQAVATL